MQNSIAKGKGDPCGLEPATSRAQANALHLPAMAADAWFLSDLGEEECMPPLPLSAGWKRGEEAAWPPQCAF